MVPICMSTTWGLKSGAALYDKVETDGVVALNMGGAWVKRGTALREYNMTVEKWWRTAPVKRGDLNNGATLYEKLDTTPWHLSGRLKHCGCKVVVYT